jgi:CheY-like chemotaxis protein
MDGEKLAALARQRLPGVKVLFASGYARSVFTDDRPLPPGTGLISKPFTFSALAQRVRKLLDQDVVQPEPEPRRIGRILVVEDEPLIRMNAVDMLEGAGFMVEEAGTAAEAIEKAKRMDGQLVAAMVDVGLPDRSGDEVATDLRKVHPDLPILVASGHSEAGLRQQFGAETGIVFVAKPYQGEDILRSLAALGVRGNPHEQSD